LFEAYYSSLASAKKELKINIKRKEVLVAVDKEVMGILNYARDYSHYANYVEDIAVSKKHRRKGVSKALMKKFIQISKKETPKKQKYALSSTEVNNKASIKMHLKFGFKKIGTLKGLHYGTDEAFFAYKLR